MRDHIRTVKLATLSSHFAPSSRRIGLKLGHAARQLVELIAARDTLKGNLFRSVASRHFHPDGVILGEGARLSELKKVVTHCLHASANSPSQRADFDLDCRRDRECRLSFGDGRPPACSNLRDNAGIGSAVVRNRDEVLAALRPTEVRKRDS